MHAGKFTLAVSRVLIGFVLFVNLQCALAFLIFPRDYSAGFELTGAVGDAMVRGMGVLFLMWNVPYLVAFWHPQRHSLAMWESVAMQTIGLLGESFIFFSVPVIHAMARASIMRFILFDGAGLLFLLAAVWLTHHKD